MGSERRQAGHERSHERLQCPDSHFAQCILSPSGRGPIERRALPQVVG